jgi:hypothetical protein
LSELIADRIVREFQKFLCQSWGSVERFLQEETTDAEDLRLDWLQVNWEILVEAALCKTPYEILEVYGDGADCNGASSRVWLPDEMPTHKIGCSSPEGSRVFDVLSSTSIELHKFEFGQFVAWDGKYYSFDVPFDHLIIERGNELAIVNATEISFNLEPISDI